MKKSFTLFLFVFALYFSSFAQDTLPRFTVSNMGNNRIVVGWVNTFETVTQISIQRSFDSLKNFKSILTVADPSSRVNGFADTKAPAPNMFYRIYIQLDKGVFLFSESKRPVWDTLMARGPITRPDNNRLNIPIIPLDSTNIGAIANGTVKPKSDHFVPSKYVYTVSDGYVRIQLPTEDDKKYSLKFFTINDEPLFELKDVKERDFKIDKANFYSSGWFRFELYQDGELLEKHRFFLPREF